jgi:murein DD-endopeptidase MepM/ murein hydrolase activator NlpD
MKKFIYIFSNVILSLAISIAYSFAPLAGALSEDQKKLYEQNILYYDLACGEGSTTTGPGEGDPEGTTFPNLDPASMAEAINKFIEQTNPNSKMKGLGETIVAGGENSNISPFLITAHAHAESDMSDPGDYNVRNGNNSFGRTATTSQPNFQGARLWYLWTSVKASVDHTAPENENAAGGGDIASYIREQYPDEIDRGDLEAYLLRYVADGNESWYSDMITRDVKKMAELSGESSGETPAPADDCCLSGETGTLLPGRNNEEKIWNYLVSELGLSDIQAAGIMGNIQQESGFDPKALNPSSGAYGIVQWFAGRKTALENYAASQNKPVSDLGVQLEFLKKELEGAYKSSVLNPIKASNNLAEVTRIWLEKFEIPCLPGSSACDAEMNTRMPFSEHWLEEFGGGSASTGTSSPSADCSTGGEGSGEYAWPDDGRKDIVTDCFGSPRDYAGGHTGIDIGSLSGQPVTAVDGGKVTMAGGDSVNRVIIDHGNGYTSHYLHNSSNSVSEGDNVERGDEIGKVGGAGGYPPHIHLDIRKNDVPENPLKHLPKDGRDLGGCSESDTRS